jgi:signal transduction histidine kinase
VKVHDNGTGFDPAAQACKGSFGLTGMQERAMALGGNFDVVSSHGQGTTISVCIPVAPAP